MAHKGKSRSDSHLGSQVKVLKPFQVVFSSLESGDGIHGFLGEDDGRKAQCLNTRKDEISAFPGAEPV